ncbi:MAG: hypothetical protein WAM97_14210, partial [Acidimicrobiales bacterium]
MTAVLKYTDGKDWEREPLFIAGERRVSYSEELTDVISPSTETLLARVALAGPSDVDRACVAAKAAHDSGEWGHLE